MKVHFYTLLFIKITYNIKYIFVNYIKMSEKVKSFIEFIPKWWVRIESKAFWLWEKIKPIFPNFRKSEILAIRWENGSFTVFIDHTSKKIVVPPGGIIVNKKNIWTGKTIQSILEKIAEHNWYTLVATINTEHEEERGLAHIRTTLKKSWYIFEEKKWYIEIWVFEKKNQVQEQRMKTLQQIDIAIKSTTE